MMTPYVFEILIYTALCSFHKTAYAVLFMEHHYYFIRAVAYGLYFDYKTEYAEIPQKQHDDLTWKQHLRKGRRNSMMI